MKILGIIAEYDPFHNGHLRHIRLAREAVQPDFIYIALSGCLKQRGEAALLSPYERARCALLAGADAVFALPAAWTVRDAEHYAMGAVSLLSRLGVTHLAFGAETEDPALLREAAEKLEYPEEAFRDRLRQLLGSGMGYPQAMSRALAAEKAAYGEILEKPNNILAVCYLRALMRLKAEIAPVPVLRRGGYHATRIDREEPSASALRGALGRGAYFFGVWEAMPACSREGLTRALLAGSVPRRERIDAMALARLRSMSREELRQVPDVSEGLEDRIQKAAARADSLEELLEAVSGKRYPKARISRICAWALLGTEKNALEAMPLPEKAVLLGLRNRPEMTALWREKQPLVTTDFTEETDLRAWKLWGLWAGFPDTLPHTEKVIRIENE